MLLLLYRYTNLMYRQLACRIRFSFALLATYPSLILRFTFPRQTVLRAEGELIHTNPSLMLQTFRVSSTLTLQYFILPSGFPLGSPYPRIKSYYFAPGLMRPTLNVLTCCVAGRAQSSVTCHVVTLVHVLYRGIGYFRTYFVYFVHFIDWYAISCGSFLVTHLLC